MATVLNLDRRFTSTAKSSVMDLMSYYLGIIWRINYVHPTKREGEGILFLLIPELPG